MAGRARATNRAKLRTPKGPNPKAEDEENSVMYVNSEDEYLEYRERWLNFLLQASR